MGRDRRLHAFLWGQNFCIFDGGKFFNTIYSPFAKTKKAGPILLKRTYVELNIIDIQAAGLSSAISTTDADNANLFTSLALFNRRFNVDIELNGQRYDFTDENDNGYVLSNETVVFDFVWPVAPDLTTSGHDGPCGDWSGHPQGCFWRSDSSESPRKVWRDVQPFQRHLNETFNAYHLGADYNLGSGSFDRNKKVFPVADGIVRATLSNVCGWGNIIFITHETSSGPITSMYAHVNWLPSGPPSGKVTPSKAIAKIGNGSWNCGSGSQGQYPYHLHLEIRDGDSIEVGRGYTDTQVITGPQGQIDPNDFIARH